MSLRQFCARHGSAAGQLRGLTGEKVESNRPEPAAAAAASDALTLLRNAVAAIGEASAAVGGAFPLEKIMASAREVYASSCTPANTMLITRILGHALNDPANQNDPEVHAFYANVRCCDYLNHWNSADLTGLAAAERAVETALRLDPHHRRAVYVSAFVHRARGRHQDALDAFERVISLKPDAGDRMQAESYAQSGAQWMYLGQPEKARAQVDKAITMTPHDSPALGVFYWIAGRVPFLQEYYLEAIHFLERSVMIRPNFWYTRAWLIAAYALSKQIGLAREALIGFRILFPQLTSVAAIIGAEENIRHSHPLLIEARHRVHTALTEAGLRAQ
jgi:tetratricopeptide (TPR) repeat protein